MKGTAKTDTNNGSPTATANTYAHASGPTSALEPSGNVVYKGDASYLSDKPNIIKGYTIFMD
jgi:hypothetical protein